MYLRALFFCILLAISSGLSGNNREKNIYKVVEMTGELSVIGVS